MIDPATGWFEIVEIPNERADCMANCLETTWLARCPWPAEIAMDRGREFCAEARALLQAEHGINPRAVPTRNPQANGLVERMHQAVHQMIDSRDIKGKRDLDAHFGFLGILSAVRSAVRASVHTTTGATPSQLVFGRDALLNVSFEADWQCVKERKQKLVIQNNKKENAKRIPHNCNVGDKAMIRQCSNRKHGKKKCDGPHTLVAVKDNGTVTLRKDGKAGAVTETWSIRNIEPHTA